MIKKWLAVLTAVWMLALPAQAAGMPEAIEPGEQLQIDLDGDGLPEGLSWRVEKDDNSCLERVALSIMCEVGEIRCTSGSLGCAEVYAQDLDGDGIVEILVTGDIISYDFVTSCMQYKDGAVTLLQFENVSRGVNGDELKPGGYGLLTAVDGDRVTLTGTQDILGTYMSSRTLRLQDGVFVIADDGLWRMDPDLSDPLTWEYQALAPNRNIEVLFDVNGTQTPGELKAGEPFVITASDKESMARFITKSGKTGTLQIARDTESGWGWLINGIPESDVLGCIPYAD